MPSHIDTPSTPVPLPAGPASRHQNEALGWPAGQTPANSKRHRPGALTSQKRSGLGHTPRAVAALLIREMSTTYGRSPIGFAWAILEPVAGILLLSLVFSLSFRSPPIGTSFALFYASGVLPYFTYTDLNRKIAQSLRFSRALLFYPRVTFLDAIISRLLLNALVQALVSIVLFLVFVQFYHIDPLFNIPAMVLSFFMAVCFALGVGMVNCYLFTFYPMWEFTWALINRPLMIMSCVLFIFDAVPQPFRGWLWWNPLIHVVGQMRKGVYPMYDGAYVSPAYVFGVSGVLAVTGLMLLRRYHRDIANA